MSKTIIKGKLLLWAPRPGLSYIGLAQEEDFPTFTSFETLFGGFIDKDVKITIEELHKEGNVKCLILS